MIIIILLLPLIILTADAGDVEQKARQLLGQELYFDGVAYYEGRLRHNVLVKEMGDGSYVALGFTGSEKAQCTGCNTYFSVLEFDAGGKLAERYMKIDTLSTRGRIDFILAEDESKYQSHEYFDVVEVRELEGEQMIMLHSGFSQQSSAFEWVYVYAKVNGKFRKVARLETGYSEQIRDPDYTGDELYATEWKAKIYLKNKKNNLPDIILKKSGKKNHKAFQETEIYEFKKNLKKFKKK